MLFNVLVPLLGLVGAALGIGTLTDDDLRGLPSPGDDFDIHNGKLLAPILIPRVPGTEGQKKTQQHFVDFFTANLPEWELIWQNSTSKTPATGNNEIPFANIILRRDPPGYREGEVGRLTLVAHYDSKIEPKDFIGAIDSAAPCAMLMHIARSIDGALKSKWDAMAASGDLDDNLEPGVGVQILLLDGEEAFVRWTQTDSLYGARSLAETWESEFHPSMSTFRTPLHSISLFVLLDLLGSPNPRVPSYFLTTHWAYNNMAVLEKRMRDLGLLESNPSSPFLPDAQKRADQFGYGGIEDDHIPFLRRGVDILHLIPTPFPDVWHTMADDGEHLDMPTVSDWTKLVMAFTAEWLDLSGHFPKAASTEKRSETTIETSKKTEL
ncbi:Glutaminyl-peptide cyclotransferase [Trichoderma lentiforme]|uniref:Peptide hydrolase n=1 Tax=Trichoderma lentiforme TaxID=1567552 RepID=A0A9P4XKA9_9HYPO|nr:Glutaminyl-peptide cyclotransferase [Trichoderma lentiforme]